MALKKLNHPNILKLITVFEHEDHFNIVFEYVERNLVQVIKHIKTEGKIRSIVFQILQGLDYLHKKGYFHRYNQLLSIEILSRKTFLYLTIRLKFAILD